MTSQKRQAALTTCRPLSTSLKRDANALKSYEFDAALAVYTARAPTTTPSTPVQPSYVRGEKPDVYGQVHWLFAADLRTAVAGSTGSANCGWYAFSVTYPIN